MSLGLNLDLNSGVVSGASWAPEPRHKSAGLAFLLSFLLPGVGQLYCGKTSRGVTTIVFWVIGATLRMAGDRSGMGLMLVIFLWVFAFLDAYFTALEINAGNDDQVDFQNPRVAATLNFLTAGLGYFYLGERTKGMVLFLVINSLKFVVGGTTGYWRGVVALLSMTVGIVMSVDAWRIATRRVQVLTDNTSSPIAAPAKPSRLPAFVPIGIATLACAAFLALAVFGTAIIALRSEGMWIGKHRGKNSFSATGKRPPTAFDRDVGDLLSTVQDIQKVEHEVIYDSGDISRLEQDIAKLNTVLGNGTLTSQDVTVSYFYRAQALRLLNIVRLQQGDEPDPSTAQGALQDYDKIASEVTNGYLRDVTPGNAGYFAGLVARDQLRNDQRANAYWEKCSSLAHAGCLHMMAVEHITGVGGQKVDLQQALQLNSFAFSIGIRGGCAPPSAARANARINHFLGARRPGDDELLWVKRAYGLLDQLAPMGRMRDVCGRSRVELDEFLYRLERGQGHPELLHDASERVGFDSPATDALIDYFSGQSDDNGFEHSMQSVKPGQAACDTYFDAMWFAQIKQKHAIAEKYFAHLKALNVPSCRQELAYARKFGF
ncbi:MAG TPA: hypothetical protein VFM77_00515 [Terriglobales bacterium]|nr:hypothetical protein [Terriglobales bacterium]